jgi:hypothetical protein
VTTTGGATLDLYTHVPDAVRSPSNTAPGTGIRRLATAVCQGYRTHDGAPGTGAGIGAIGSGIAAVLARWLRVPRRTEVVDTDGTVAAGRLFFSCLLGGAVVIHEMSVTSRPSKITVDAVVATSPSDRYRSDQRRCVHSSGLVGSSGGS